MLSTWWFLNPQVIQNKSRSCLTIATLLFLLGVLNGLFQLIDWWKIVSETFDSKYSILVQLWRLIWSFGHDIHCLFRTSNCPIILYQSLIDVRAHHYRNYDALHIRYVRNYLNCLFRCLTLRCLLAFPSAYLLPLQLLQYTCALKPIYRTLYKRNFLLCIRRRRIYPTTAVDNLCEFVLRREKF